LRQMKNKWASLSKNGRLTFNTELLEIAGTEKVERAVMRNIKEDEQLQMTVDAIVLAVGLTPNTEIFKKLGIELTEKGYIKTDRSQKTSMDGIYAIGDVASEVQFTVVAIAHGLIVAHNAYTQLRKPYWL